MSDSISAVGGISQAMPVSLVNNAQARDSAAKPQTAANTARADAGEFRGIEQTQKTNSLPNEGELLTRTGKDSDEKNAFTNQPSPTVEDAVKTLKEYVNNLPSEFEFKFDKEAGRQIMKVVNPVTREVIRQYPPEELLTLAKRLKEMEGSSKDSGFLFDDRF